IAIPASSRLATCVCFAPLAKAKVMKQITVEPTNEKTGSTVSDNTEPTTNNELKKTKYKAAVNAAPVLIPISPGSASGLRNNPCNTTPLHANAAPTATLINTRGRRIFQTIAACCGLTSLAVKPILDEMTFNTSPAERFTAPITHTQRTDTTRAASNDHIIMY